ncbi:MAG TPA: PKD domain-containing protein [Methanocella sp.]|jgi:hypothetical protein
MHRETIGVPGAIFAICLTGLAIATLFTALAVAEPPGPGTSISLDGRQSGTGWFTSDVTVRLSATDYSGLGINRTEYNFNGSESAWLPYTGPVNITKEGSTAIFYRSVDNASMAESTKTAVINIDKTPPSLTYVLTPALNANGWTSQDVHLHYEASDAVSGLASTPKDLLLTNEGTYADLSGTATDLAGNSASVTVPTLGIDRTPPRVGSLTLAGNAYVGDYLPVSASVVEENLQRCEWDFGDGTGTAAMVSNNVARGLHAYKQPGSYRITLNVADRAGNAVAQTASVTIYGTGPTALPTATPVPTPEATPTPTTVPLPSATPKPAPAADVLLTAMALVITCAIVGRITRD